MKASELLEYRENKGSSASVSYEFLDNYVDVNLNIDTRNLRAKPTNLRSSHPDNPGEQEYNLKRWAKDNNRQDVISEIKEFKASEKEYQAYLETETLELVESLKSMINAMILDGHIMFSDKWNALYSKYSNDIKGDNDES